MKIVSLNLRIILSYGCYPQGKKEIKTKLPTNSRCPKASIHSSYRGRIYVPYLWIWMDCDNHVSGAVSLARLGHQRQYSFCLDSLACFGNWLPCCEKAKQPHGGVLANSQRQPPNMENSPSYDFRLPNFKSSQTCGCPRLSHMALRGAIPLSPAQNCRFVRQINAYYCFKLLSLGWFVMQQ